MSWNPLSRYGQPRVTTGIKPGPQGRHSVWVTQRVELIRKLREQTREELREKGIL